MLPVVGLAAAQAVGPLLVMVPVAVVLVSMVAMQGIPFSMDPVAPKLSKVNPAEGFKKLFALRSLIELVKSLVKTGVIVAVFICVLMGGLRALTLSPACGLGCQIDVFASLSRPLLGAAALLFVLAGAADYGLQRWLFRRDQKMSVSEQKRERKDMDGDPHLRRERRRLMREALRLAGGLGLKKATVVIVGDGGTMIGLRYKLAEMPAPVVVCRARGERGRSMLAEALAMQLPNAEDSELAEGLFRVPLGHGIPEKLFRPMAFALRRAGQG
jgi:type III secretion protein U